MNPVLFLDIDGVLNNHPSMERHGHIADFHSAIFTQRPLLKEGMNFDPLCVNQIQTLQIRYNMKVVISSSWRFNAHPKHFIEVFNQYGWNLNTVCLTDTGIQECPIFNRSQIIEKYIRENDVRNFVMVDDTPALYDRLLDKLVLTNPMLGFTADDLVKASDILEEING